MAGKNPQAKAEDEQPGEAEPSVAVGVAVAASDGTLHVAVPV